MSQSTSECEEKFAEPDDLTESDRHRLLAAERRRQALDILVGQTPSVDLADLAAAVATRDPDIDAADGQAVTRVAASLHHFHLPMMADYGVIDYDPMVNRVTSCPSRQDT